MTESNFYSHCQQKFNHASAFLNLPDGHTYSYADLHHQSGRIAHHLTKLGVHKGDRVIVQVEKSPQNLFWYFACLRAGFIYIPLNTAYLEHEVEYFIGNAAPSFALCDPSRRAIFDKHANCNVGTLDNNGNYLHDNASTGHFGHADYEIHNSEDTDFKDEACDAADIAVTLYTSGTTGNPKGAMITHGNLVANAATLSSAWGWQTDDVLLHALPIFHIHGLFVATHLVVFNGSQMNFMTKFDPQLVVDWLPKSSIYMGVPTNYVRLLAHEGLNGDACNNMRLFTSGSAPLLTQTFEDFEQRTGHTIVERYGMTETGMNTSNPLLGKRKPGTVGPALAGVETKICDDLGQQVAVGQAGTLYVKGANVFKGYWQMPDKTAEEFTDDGFFKTGDIASLDEDGYISIIGRDKDMIISGGLNVYPKEIESILDKINGVTESAVIGVPHADFGEAVVAVIVCDDIKAKNGPLSEKQIIAEMKTTIAGFKVPKQIHFVDALPRNTMGKVQKNILRETYRS